MPYKRITRDEYQIMASYSGGAFECECAEDTRRDAKRLLKEYRENGGGVYFLRKVRVPLDRSN